MTRILAAVALALALPLAACATTPDRIAAAEGSAVKLGQPVALAGLTLTPMTVVEDSRCPINARCVWAGRIVVTTSVDGAGWSENANLILGEPQQVRGTRVALVSAEPGRMAGQDTAMDDYRFVFEGG